MKTQRIITPTPEPYIPPEFSSPNILEGGDLPAGGTLTVPNANSVVKILDVSSELRDFLIFNTGQTIVHLFRGGTEASWLSDLRTPYRLSPGESAYSELPTCKLAIFAWSEGMAGKLIIEVVNL